MEAPTSQTLFSISGAGALSASLLSEACELDLEFRSSLQLEVVRDLAEDLKSRLDKLARPGAGDDGPANLPVEAALRCADLANLAACNLPELSEAAAPRAAASVHLAAGAAQALGFLAENGAPGPGGTHPDNVRRDARGARWRTDLAVRQVDEFVRGASQNSGL